MTKQDRLTFISSYMGTALWADLHDDNGDPVTGELAPCAKFRMMRRACRFLQESWELIEAEGLADGYGMAGHDLWLTHNGHGVGFWDGDWPLAGDELSDLAEHLGECDLYQGDDGRVYLA